MRDEWELIGKDQFTSLKYLRASMKVLHTSHKYKVFRRIRKTAVFSQGIIRHCVKAKVGLLKSVNVYFYMALR